MTDKQRTVCYYRIKGYSARHCSLICGVSDSYARRIVREVEEVDLTDYKPPIDCIVKERTLNHILEGVGFVFVPNSEKYAYISLLGYLGIGYKELKHLFPNDQGQFIYMALHRSNKAWRNLNSDFMGIDQVDYDELMNIRRKETNHGKLT